MPFKKWISIENHYQNKLIDYFIQKFGDKLNKESFIISEKNDGANFSIIFYPEGRWQFAKRSGVIASDENFYDYKTVFQTDKARKFLKLVSEYCMTYQKTLQFVGELFGQGIQKRVYYGPDKYWNWFAIYEHIKEGKVNLLDFEEETTLIENITGDSIAKEIIIKSNPIFDMCVPYLSKITGLDKAIEFDININSRLTPKDYDKENLIEGIVIRPIHNYQIDNTMLILKKKNPKFDDKNHEKKEYKQFNVKEDLQSLYDKTIGYVNENRTADLFSKFGVIPSITQLGKYLGAYMKDIHDDVIKDYPLDFDNLDKKEQKWLTHQFIPLIKKELMKEL